MKRGAAFSIVKRDRNNPDKDQSPLNSPERSSHQIVTLQSRAISELINAAGMLSAPADFDNLLQLESGGRIPRLTMLRAQVEWIRHEVLDSGAGMVRIGGFEPEKFPQELRKNGFGIISALLGPIIKSRFSYLRSFHTDGPLYHPVPPRYLGWCILGGNRETLRFETISARSLALTMEQHAPRLAGSLYQSFPFDSGEEVLTDERIAANASSQSFISSGRPAGAADRSSAGEIGRTAVPIIETAASGEVIRFNRQYIERGFRSLGVDSQRFEAAAKLFTVLDTVIEPVVVTVGRGEILFINNHRLLHSRDPVSREAKPLIPQNNVDNSGGSEQGDTVCRSWIGIR